MSVSLLPESVADPGLEFRSCGNVILLPHPKQPHTANIFYNNEQLRYTENLFYTPPILVVWRRNTSQTGAFTTGQNVLK
jgi:hypothetical protein